MQIRSPRSHLLGSLGSAAAYSNLAGGFQACGGAAHLVAPAILIVAALAGTPAVAADPNVVFIEQIGASADINIEQVGSGNLIRGFSSGAFASEIVNPSNATFDGAGASVDIRQTGSENVVNLDTTSSSGFSGVDFQAHFTGSANTLAIACQTCASSDIKFLVNGDGNLIRVGKFGASTPAFFLTPTTTSSGTSGTFLSPGSFTLSTAMATGTIADFNTVGARDFMGARINVDLSSGANNNNTLLLTPDNFSAINIGMTASSSNTIQIYQDNGSGLTSGASATALFGVTTAGAVTSGVGNSAEVIMSNSTNVQAVIDQRGLGNAVSATFSGVSGSAPMYIKQTR